MGKGIPGREGHKQIQEGARELRGGLMWLELGYTEGCEDKGGMWMTKEKLKK